MELLKRRGAKYQMLRVLIIKNLRIYSKKLEMNCKQCSHYELKQKKLNWMSSDANAAYFGSFIIYKNSEYVINLMILRY